MNKDKTTREQAIEWWNNLTALERDEAMDRTGIDKRIRATRLTNNEVEEIYLLEHPQTEEQVKEVDILGENKKLNNIIMDFLETGSSKLSQKQIKELELSNKRLKEVNKLLLEALDGLLSSYRADFTIITGAPLNNTESVLKAKSALKEANLINTK